AIAQGKLFEYAAEALDDSALGLHLAKQANPREAGVLFYVASAAKKIGEALALFERYFRIVNEAVRLKTGPRSEVHRCQSQLCQRSVDCASSGSSLSSFDTGSAQKLANDRAHCPGGTTEAYAYPVNLGPRPSPCEGLPSGRRGLFADVSPQCPHQI